MRDHYIHARWAAASNVYVPIDPHDETIVKGFLENSPFRSLANSAEMARTNKKDCAGMQALGKSYREEIAPP